MGKTRLAIEAARAQVGRYADGVWFVDLAPVASADLAPGIILRALDAPDRGAAEARRQLLSYLHNKTMLLVLDNCEHLLDAVGLLAEALRSAQALKLLVTSRTRLNLREEWLQPLVGLDAPLAEELHEPGSGSTTAPALSLAELEAYDATHLFLQCVRRLQPDFQWAPEETSLVAHICRQLEGMPLGIELVASWIRSLPLSVLAVEVEGSLSLLSTSLHDMPPRHRSMDAVFDHSWRLAQAHEQSILCQLSVFRGGFTRGAAEAVASALLPDLGNLVDKSWLRLQPSGRYVLHELTRQFCAEKLDGETAGEVRRRHCMHYSLFLHEQMQRMNYHQDVADNVMAEFGDLQAAWGWIVDHGDLQVALDMVVNLLFVGEMEGWYHFVVRVYETAAARLAPFVAPNQSDASRRQAAAVVLGWIEFGRGNLFNHLGLLEKARACVEANSTLVNGLEPGDAREELIALNEWLDGMVLYFEGEFSQARRVFCKRLAYFRTSAVDFSVYGHAVGARFWEAHTLGSLALTAYLLGDYPEAKRRLREVVALREEAGEVRFRAFNLGLWARVLEAMGDYGLAGERARESLSLSQVCGDQIGMASARLALGRVEAAVGRYTLGQEHCQQSLAVARQSGNHHLLMDSLVQLGRIELALGRPDTAKAYFDEAVASFVRLDTAHSNRVAAALIGLGWSALARGENAPAEQFFREALDAKGRAAWETMDAVAGLAQALATEGRAEPAVALCSYVLRARATAHATRVYVEKSTGTAPGDAAAGCLRRQHYTRPRNWAFALYKSSRLLYRE